MMNEELGMKNDEAADLLVLIRHSLCFVLSSSILSFADKSGNKMKKRGA
jgi:hypothetical protein